MSKKKRHRSLPVTSRRKKEAKIAEGGSHGREAPRQTAVSTVSPSPEKRAVLKEKGGLLVYTGPVHGDLQQALDEQREQRARALYGG